MIKIFSVVLYIICLMSCDSQSIESNREKQKYTKALVNFNDYEKLTEEVKDIRSNNLISFDDLLKFSKEEDTVILDTRSNDKFKIKHVEGAINIPFTEFTQTNLREIIPHTNTRILIYCNNNFEGDEQFFASKLFSPDVQGKQTLIANSDSIMLALNIPTYINLYGYGYRNIFELDELININDSRLKLEGNNGVKSFGQLFLGKEVQID